MTQYRYMITRPCLLEGSLTIAKYMRPLFPQELHGQALTIRDEQGREYSARLNAAGSQVTGMGGLYHAMNLSVNDVLLLERVGSSEYRAQGVSKPYSRPQPPETHSVKAEDVPTRRVVIEASPHVREIRLERETAARAEPLDGKVEVRREGEALPAPERAEALPAARVEVRQEGRPLEARQVEARALETRAERGASPRPEVIAAERLAAARAAERSATEREELTASVRPVVAQPNQFSQPSPFNQPSQVGEGSGQLQQAQVITGQGASVPAGVPAAPLRAELLNRDPERLARASAARPAELRPAERSAVQGGTAQTGPTSTPARLPDILTGQVTQRPAPVANTAPAASTAPVATGQSGAVPTTATRPQPAAVQAVPLQPAPPAPSRVSAETLKAQLQQLAELTGYQLEYLGGPATGASPASGPARLRADLGVHGYDVMLALTEADMQHPAFKQGTYRALMTWEVDTASGAPRFTREALVALLENARLAPLTPLELRPYWNTASFDLSSVANVAELVSAYLAQRGTFTYVLSILAQQSAHTVVDPQRLAEKLGSGVNGAELRVVLDTLSRPPFMALLPLQGGQYYLRAEVGTILHDLSQYATGVARRLQPPTRAAAAVQASAAPEAASGPNLPATVPATMPATATATAQK